MVVYRELSSLENDLGIDAKTLYAVSNTIDRHYRQVEIPKKNGGFRELSVPDGLLKKIQRRITQVLLVHMPISKYATAYRYGGSTRRNAAPHVGQPMVLKLDIRNFFDNILYTTVKETAFPAEIYAEPLRILLTILCYGRDVLPQGAPSSPIITNILMREFDDAVGSWCRERKIAYTRYCDDMTFSGMFQADEVKQFISGQLRSLGLFLNEEKARLLRSGQRQTITGIVVNQKLGVPSDYQRKLRQELYFCRKFGVASHLEHCRIDLTEEAYLTKLLGQVNYVLQIAGEGAEMLAYKDWLMEQLKSVSSECTKL
jgi:retron-type reverse transcriptase